MSRHILILFLDGVGLGDANPEANPFVHVNMTTVQALLGVPHLTREAAGTISSRAALLGLDAVLNVPGLPQSATGQTTILTGRNAPAIIGQHYGPYPNQALRAMLAEDSLFKVLRQAGYGVAYANAYPARFLDRLQRGKGRLSANTQAAVMAGLRLRSSDDLRQGRAISALLSNEFWPETEVFLPPVSQRQAGRHLAQLAQDHALTFFEFWYSDLIGHRNERPQALDVLHSLDEFIAGILERLDLTNSMLLVTSDHGNFEDWTTNKHTRNPALTLLAGAGLETMAPQLQSLVDLKPAVLSYLA